MLGGSLRAFSRCERPTTPRTGAAVVLGCSTLICGCGGAAGAGGWDWDWDWDGGWGVAAILIAFTVLQITEVLALSELSADISILLSYGALFSSEILETFSKYYLHLISLPYLGIVCFVGFLFLFYLKSLFLNYYIFIFIQTQLETIHALYPFHGKHYFKKLAQRHGSERKVSHGFGFRYRFGAEARRSARGEAQLLFGLKDTNTEILNRFVYAHPIRIRPTVSKRAATERRHSQRYRYSDT